MRWFVVLLAGMTFGACAACIFTRWKIQRTLDRLRKDEDSEKELRKAAEKSTYMESVEKLVDKCAEQRTREKASQIFDKQTELTALQSQINPHFLYNTLECIRGQALIDDNVEIAKMTEALSSFFRYSISKNGNFVTLREELDNINNYMLIQQYRFNNRFTLEIMIDEEDKVAYDYLVPKLIIQPVIENAIFHGLEEKVAGGRVTIEIILTDTSMMLIVSDNGKGIEKEKLKELNERIHATNMYLETKKKGSIYTGIALPNVNKRIQLLFGSQYGLNVYSTPGRGTDVEITVPVDYMRKAGWKNEEGTGKDF